MMYYLNPFDYYLTFISVLVIILVIIIINHKSDDDHHQHSSKRAGTRAGSGGPPTYPVIGCLISFYQNRRRLLDWYTELLSESASQTIKVSRLGARKVIVTANSENVEYILKSNFGNYPKGKPLAEILGDLLGDGIFNVDGELWASQRKLASHEFSTKSLREFVVKTLEDEVQLRLIPLLQLAANQHQIIDLQEVLKRFTYDSICKVSLGLDPNCLDLSVPIPPLIAAFENAAAISAMRATSPIYIIWKLKRVLNLGSENQLKQSIHVLHQLVESIITSKQNTLSNSPSTETEAETHDLLSRFLSAGYETKLARDMVISFIMAGRDTTAAAMTWLFWLLTTHHDARAGIRAELAGVPKLGSGTLGYEVVKKGLTFLHACLCEAMRLYPPVAWDSKHALNDDVLPDGTKVNKGDRVTYFPYGMGRMEAIWGEDRFSFKPDRWFENGSPVEDNTTTRKLKMVNPYEYPIFQAGPRVCLGKEMAFTQMKYVMASVINRFDFELVSSETPKFVPLLTAHMAGGLRVRVKEIMSKLK